MTVSRVVLGCAGMLLVLLVGGVEAHEVSPSSHMAPPYLRGM
jgi:hypothetical protein